MPTPRKTSLTARVHILEAALRVESERAAAHALKASQAEQSKASANAAVNTLKERLADALADVARLNGYIERIHEQDDANADRVPIGPESIPTLVPATRLARGGGAAEDFYNGRIRFADATPHWTAL